MFLFRARIFGTLQVAGKIKKIAKLGWRVFLDRQQRAIAKIETHNTPPLNFSSL
jgi:hypothetical protein